MMEKIIRLADSGNIAAAVDLLNENGFGATSTNAFGLTFYSEDDILELCDQYHVELDEDDMWDVLTAFAEKLPDDSTGMEILEGVFVNYLEEKEIPYFEN